MSEVLGSIEVTFDGARLAALFQKMGTALDAELARIALGAAQIAAGNLRKEIMGRLTKGPTGALARSVRVELLLKGTGEITAQAAAHMPYALIQDLGGPIEAHGKLLAVPIRGRVPKGMGPRDFPAGKLRLIPGKFLPGGNSVLVENRKLRRGEKLSKVLFVLKKRVVIPGVGYVDAANKASEAAIEDYVNTKLDALIAKVMA